MLTNIHPASFDAEIKGVIVGSEKSSAPPYLDRTNIPRAKATIGYGFNIEVRDNLRLVLSELNILTGMNAQTVENTLDLYLDEMARVIGNRGQSTISLTVTRELA